MRRQGRQRSQQGLLLVEAVLSAVVIGVSLVFITRGLAGELSSLRTVKAYDTLLDLAEEKMAQLESQRLFDAVSSAQPSEGTFSEPYQRVHWRIKAQLFQQEDTASHPPVRVALTVWADAHPGISVTLSALWPSNWASELWF